MAWRPESVYKVEVAQLDEVLPVPPFEVQEIVVKRYSTGVVESEPTVEDILIVDVPVSLGTEAQVIGSGVGGLESPAAGV